VTQYENGGYHNSTAGIGTHWDDNTTDADASIVRIAMVGSTPDGTVEEICGFYSPFEPFVAPEPGSLVLLAGGMAVLGSRRGGRLRRVR
jgi:hypothetical protein